MKKDKRRKQAKPRQPGFFDIQDRAEQLTKMGDPLVGLKAQIDWEAFCPELQRVHDKERKSLAGAKPYDVVLMFKMLVLQRLHNLADEKVEYLVRDRLSFMRFLGLQLEDRVPDGKSVWLFRERLKAAGLFEVMFQGFHGQLAARGYEARSGQMIDATFVEVPRKRNTREENARIKAPPAGEDPGLWKDEPDKRAQKDTDARWVKKNEQVHYGYKNHVNVDQDTKLIECFEVTPASVHDSAVFGALVDASPDEQGATRAVSADSAYRSAEREAGLEVAGIRSEICEKGTRGAPLSEEQKRNNRTKSKVRARVEHVFGQQAHMGGHIVRTIGMARARAKITMMNLVYNMVRLVQLIARAAKNAGGAQGVNPCAVG
ncbi:MAG: IS5 family transposase [Burkholderiales bacterium]